MKEWEAAVRKKAPAAATLCQEELFNSLPDFLEKIADGFSHPKGSAEWVGVANEIQALAKQHGELRATQAGYTLDQVIAEHQILRHTLFDFALKETPVNPEQLSILLESVDAGISEAASAFGLEKGFKEARYSQLESEKSLAQSERNTAQSQVSRLEQERAMRDQFVSALSHDLRTPITSAKQAAELLAHDPKNHEKVSKLAARISDDLTRSDRMIRDLLDANRIRFGEKLPMALRETKLVELLNCTLANLVRIYGDRFTLDASHEVVGHWSGADLERSVENLVINAVKYGAPDAPINLRVQDQGENVSISVHNVGSLITPSEQRSLFQPFAQLRKASKGVNQGWGLGLALAQGITEAHGGKVWVESDARTGTTFTILIPKDARPRRAA